MKYPKLPVIGNLLLASAVSSYLTYSYLSIQRKREEMATKSCAEECRLNAQEMKLYCPPQRTFVTTGNWKMNGDKKMVDELLKILWCGPISKSAEVIIGVPAPYIEYAQLKKPKAVEIAGQNIYKEPNGPYTGEISADMLIDLKSRWVILGASERKHYFHEDYELIAEKVKFAVDKELNVVLCVGETSGERECNEHVKSVLNQLSTVSTKLDKEDWKRIIIAYEPEWVVNSTRTLTSLEAQEVAGAIREWINEHIDSKIGAYVRIQYGGPITLECLKAFTRAKDIDGFYVGSFSLKPEFIDIINANG